MKFFKSFIKTFLFSIFAAIIISSTGNNIVLDVNIEDTSIAICYGECPPDLDYSSLGD